MRQVATCPPWPQLDSGCLVEQIEPKLRVGAISFHSIQHRASAGWKAVERGIVFDRLEGAFIRKRDLHAWVEDVQRVERRLHVAKPIEHVGRPNARQEWRTE